MLGAVTNPARRGCIPRTTHPGCGQWGDLSGNCENPENEWPDHCPLEDALRTGRYGGLRRPSSGQQTAFGHARRAGAGDRASAAETGRLQHPLVLPKTGEPVGSQQVYGAANSVPGATETAPTGTVYD